MNVVQLLWRTRLRSSWRSAAILVVLIGLGGSVTLAVAAGARRTASANDAILEVLQAYDVGTSFGAEDPERIRSALRAVPDVSDAEVWVGFSGRPQGIDPASFNAVLGFWSERPGVERPIPTSGRLPVGPTEAFLNEKAARRSGLGVGSRVPLALADRNFEDFATVEVDIVGIGVFSDGVIEDELGGTAGIWLSRQLTERYLDRQQFGVGLLRLRRGDVPAVSAGLAAISDVDNRMMIDNFQAEDRRRVQDALQPLLWALAGLAGLAGAATVLVTSQALGRTLRGSRADDQSLAAMGCTTRQLVIADLGYVASVTLVGIALAVALAVAASPLFPVGPPRRVPAVKGLDIDVAALGLGSLVVVGAILVAVGFGSWRRRARPGSVTPGRAPGPLGLRPATATGLRLLSGRRRTGSLIVGVGGSLTAVVAILSFTGSLDHLAADPTLSGMSWDVLAREAYTVVDLPAAVAVAQAEPSLRRMSALAFLDGELNGVKTPIAEVRPVVGEPWPPIVAGRAPRSSSEMLLGRATMGALRLRLGDQVRVSLSPGFNDFDGDVHPPPGVRSLTIVGSAVAPAIGLSGFDTPRLDVGAFLPGGVYQEIFGHPLGSDVVLFDLGGGSSAPLIARFPDGLPDQKGVPTEWFTSAVPAEIGQAEEARTVIDLAVAALAAAIVATIAHTLLGFVRQRRRDYAVLKALGFTRGQIRTTVLTQSGAILALALIAALPLGLAAGRWLWTAYAERIGVVVEPTVPLLLLAAATLLSILAVQSVALIPASLARRTPAGRTLHGE